VKKFTIFSLFFVCLIIFLTACTAHSQYYSSKKAIENGDVVVLEGEIYNIDRLDMFIDSINRGEKTKVQIDKYNTKNNPAMYIIEFDGKLLSYSFARPSDDDSKDILAGVNAEIVKTSREENEDGINYYLIDNGGFKTCIFTVPK